MVELTVQVPDELAQQLRSLDSELTEIIELGLREIKRRPYDLPNEVIDFLATGPSAQAIIAFHPSVEAQARVAELLYKNRAGLLTPEEQAELDRYENLDYFFTLIKARARQRMAKAA